MTRRTAAAIVVVLFVALLPGARADVLENQSSNVRRLTTVENVPPNSPPWPTTFLAFEDDIMVAGAAGWEWLTGANNMTTRAKGFGIFRILRRKPYLKQIGFHRCPPGEYADVSLWRDFVFLSVGKASDYIGGVNDYESPTCNTRGTRGKGGIRVVDISNPGRPREVAFFQTSCGSLSHTIYPSSGSVFIYNPIGGSCPEGVRAPTFKMDVIEFNPKRPRVPSSWSHPPIEQEGCVESFVLESRSLFGCVNAELATLYSLADPFNPEWLSTIAVPGAVGLGGIAATWDGNLLALSDQGVDCPPSRQIADVYFYSIEDLTNPERRGNYSLERSVIADDRREIRTCNPYSITIVPMRDPARYVLAAGFAAGGMTLVDFTNSEEPREVAYWYEGEGNMSSSDIGPTVWYQGRFYATEWQTARGIHVFEIETFDRSTVHEFRRRFNMGTQLNSDLR